MLESPRKSGSERGEPSQDDFAERLASTDPTPGGGAAAARVGLYGIALLRMAGGITLSKAPRDPQGEVREAVARIAEATAEAAELSRTFRELEADDVRAFEAYLRALRLPRGTPEESERRRAALGEASVHAARIPLETMDAALEVLRLAERLACAGEQVRLRARSDIGAGVELAAAAFRAAEFTVRANLPGLRGRPEEGAIRRRWVRLAGAFERLYPRVRARALALLEEGT